MIDADKCRQAYDDFYHKIKAEVGYDHWCAIWRFISKRQARREPMEADTEDLIERLLDAQQDINLAANEHMSQPLCDASALIDEIEQVLRRLSTRPRQIPEGWQPVPKRPTEQMVEAANNGDDEYTLRNFGPSMQRVMQGPEDHYVAMLAAAPKPEDTP